MSCFSSSALGRSRLLPSTRTWNVRKERNGWLISSAAAFDLAHQTLSGQLSCQLTHWKPVKISWLGFRWPLSAMSSSLSHCSPLAAVINNYGFNHWLWLESPDPQKSMWTTNSGPWHHSFWSKDHKQFLTGIPCSCGLSKRLCSSFLEASIFSLSAASTM